MFESEQIDRCQHREILLTRICCWTRSFHTSLVPAYIDGFPPEVSLIEQLGGSAYFRTFSFPKFS